MSPEERAKAPVVASRPRLDMFSNGISESRVHTPKCYNHCQGDFQNGMHNSEILFGLWV